MNIAIVGSGISGLSAAWMLARQHEVTVFEQNDYLGGHTHTVDAPAPDGAVAVDTGFIVYNEANYPHLTALFRHLGVATRDSDMSFGVSIDGGALEYAGDNLNALFGQRRNLLKPSHWQMLREILRFNRLAKRLLDDPELDTQSLGDFLDAHRFGETLRTRYLLPMAAAIWSCPPRTMLAFPAAGFMRFFNNHGLLDVQGHPQWRTVVGGSHSYVGKLTEHFRSGLRVGQGVRTIRRDDKGVTVVDQAGTAQRFDQVVLACHADQALALLEQPGFWESSLLGAFPYQPNRVVLHSDARLMPQRRRLWSSWNYLSGTNVAGDRAVAVSYWMNRLQGLPETRPYFVTLNPLSEPDPAQVWGEYHYDHPVFSQRAMRAQPLLDRIQGQRRTWFCGAYFGYGFHEDGIRSGLAVGRAFGITPPWEERLPERITQPAGATGITRQPLPETA
ncbi:MAG: FAD-dependent oxidoreductase [Pseudomonadota bacterium]